MRAMSLIFIARDVSTTTATSSGVRTHTEVRQKMAAKIPRRRHRCYNNSLKVDEKGDCDDKDKSERTLFD